MIPDVTPASEASAAASPAVATTILPPRRIGRVLRSGSSVVARVVHVTYQQKTHVSGRIAPTVGVIREGSGGVWGGGGLIGSSNESVATLILADRNGAEETLELPADVAARDHSVLRLDRLDGRTFSVTNLTAHRGARPLLGPADFVPMRPARWFDVVGVLFAVIALSSGHAGWALVFGARPAWVAWRIADTHRQWRELRAYMAEIAS